jgi:hypothetical protein
VEILWIHNQQWAKWERSLPAATHKLLQQHRKGESGKGGVHHKSMVKRETLDGQLEQGISNGVSDGQSSYSVCSVGHCRFSWQLRNDASHLALIVSCARPVDIQQHI